MIQDTGFTLLEILIAIFIFSVIVTTIFASYNSVFSNSESIDQGITTYEMSKNCLNRMAIDLKSIHVSLPPEYVHPDFDDPPDPFINLGLVFSNPEDLAARVSGKHPIVRQFQEAFDPTGLIVYLFTLFSSPLVIPEDRGPKQGSAPVEGNQSMHLATEADRLDVLQSVEVLQQMLDCDLDRLPPMLGVLL